jgi:alpha-glucosidase (family GH31 glycosyl hydrolase)
MEPGILSRDGWTIIDESSRHLLEENDSDWGEWVTCRPEGRRVDWYIFAYGHDYLDALSDFTKVSGKIPLPPKYAFGYWWSRYWKYTEESYSALLKKFKEKKMPFTVAMMDMDWHVTEVDPKYGRGWTGYTWNREFFPDPARFLKHLHDSGMHCGFNLHPADGVQGFEDAYPAIAKEMGVDTSREDPVNFDIASPKFVKAYFKHLIHTNEDMGADFWWIDWQQGKESGIKGLDPLWGLNHFHYLDNCKKDRRGAEGNRRVLYPFLLRPDKQPSRKACGNRQAV